MLDSTPNELRRSGPSRESTARQLLFSSSMFSSASFLSFISVASASFAPAAVLASTTVCKQPAHLILAIFAAFLWSCAISVVALVWIALFRPLGAPLWVVALCAVVLQELARWATYALFEAMLRGLRSAGLMPHDGPRTPLSRCRRRSRAGWAPA